MRHIKTQRFNTTFKSLPPEIKKKARECFKLFLQDRSHPSLRIEKIQGYHGVWSGRITRRYRWTFHYAKDPETGETICVHRVIGLHDDVYDSP